MPNKEMDEFLAAPGPAPAADPPVAEAVIEAPAEAVPAEGAPPGEPPKPPEVAAADDGEPEDVKGLRSALVAERNKRNDYKGERDRLQGEVAALKAQMEAFAKTQHPAPSASTAVVPAAPAQRQLPEYFDPMPPAPNPLEDPNGYLAWQSKAFERHGLQQQFWATQERFNSNEDLLRSKIGDEEADKAIELFKEMAAADPLLGQEIQRQRRPYQWLYEEVQKRKALQEIGPDLKGWEAKKEAEIEARVTARLQAEFANAPMATAPQPPRIPQSLGTARSAASRTEQVEQAVPFEQMFGPKRKRA